MVVYADMVFLLNLCIDFLILWLTTVIRRQRTSFWRLLAASSLGAVYAVMRLWQPASLGYTLPAKLLISVLMVGIALGVRHPMAFLRSLGIFYLISFVTGGGMFALHYVLEGEVAAGGGMFLTQSSGWGSPVSWVFILLAFPLVWMYARISFRSLQQRQAVNQYLARVAIHLENRRLECTGLIDTGNQLRDPLTRTPVMMAELDEMSSYLPKELVTMVKNRHWDVVNVSLPPEWMTRIRLIPFRGAGSKGGVMLALKPDRVEVMQDQRWVEAGKVLIGLDTGRLSSDGTYQAIIHPSCMPAAG